MMEPDIRREALQIFLDSLGPRVKNLLDHASSDDITILREREVLEEFQRPDEFSAQDPLTVLTLLASMPNYRQIIFHQVPDDHVQKRIKEVRLMRNRWAHFEKWPPKRRSQDLNAVRWLLERANDTDASARLGALYSHRPRPNSLGGPSELNEEINRRASEIAQRERELRRQQQEADQREALLSVRIAAIDERNQDLEERQQLIERGEVDIEHRRATVEQRERELQQAPLPTELRSREEALRAEETAVAQLRREYGDARNEQRRRSAEIARQERDIERRNENVARREAEVDQMRETAEDLSERLTDVVQRLERLEHHQRRSATIAPTSVSKLPETENRGDPRRRQAADRSASAQKSHKEQGLCRRMGCSGRMVEKSGRFGQFLGCDNFPNCRYTEIMSDAAQLQDFGSCPDCKNPLTLRPGYSGPFLGCGNYPHCKYTQTLDEGMDDDWLAGVRERYTLESS